MRTLTAVPTVVEGGAPSSWADGTKYEVKDVAAWIEAQRKKGDMTDASASVRMTSLNQMSSMVADDEPKHISHIYDTIDRLRERWARKNPAKGTITGKTYASRAHATISEFLRWAAAPDRYDPKRERSSPAQQKKPSKTESQPKAVIPPVATAPAIVAPRAITGAHDGEEVRNFPLAEDRAIRFMLPAGGMTFAEVRKFAVHLFTLSTDFNIADEAQAKTFSMVVRGE